MKYLSDARRALLPDLEHDEVCAILYRHGFRLGGFAERMSMALDQEPWRNDGEIGPAIDEHTGEPITDCINAGLIEAVGALKLRPDAYRIREEGVEHGWNHPVLGCDVVEVIHTNAPDDHKWRKYEQLWRMADNSDAVSIRFWETSLGDRFAPMFPACTSSDGAEDVEFPSSITLDELVNLTIPKVSA